MNLVNQIKEKIQGDKKVLHELYLRSTNRAARSDKWHDHRNADGVPIMARKAVSSSDLNLRVNHDLFNQIAKEKAGYFASNIKRTYADNVPESVADKYLDFDRRNSIAKKFKNIAVSCASWGVSYSLCRISEAGNIIIDEIPAWMAHVEYDDEGQPTDGYIYETVDKKLVVRHYTSTEVTKYVEGTSTTSVNKHGFGVMPLTEWRNDESMQGNSERCVSLIDAYDLMVSDNSTEQAAFRNAYLLLSNLGHIDEDKKESMRKTGVITGDGDNAKAEFITKNINPQFAQLVMETVWQNIFVVSSTVDTKALTTLGNATAFQIGQIYRNLENDSQNTELEWEQSLEHLDRILKSFWTTLDAQPLPDYSTYDINYEFKRNLPKDTLSDLEAIKRAGGIIPNYEILRRTLNIDEDTAKALAEEANEEMGLSLPEIE